ncbi:hypothetical protein TWF481_005278 [Arthrobotrys musiformis]|uniref:Peptidyl-tRNA hydrolase n=1 Tax=Arthrobotrys musiformis TaxID=47236 RepID=A0AAV9WIY7_9PEZI
MGIKGKRKQQRRQQQLQQQIATEETQTEDSNLIPASSTAESSPSTSPSTSTSSIPPPFITPPFEMAASQARSLLICAIGNPGKLLTTRHSAAHLLLPHLTSSQLSPSRSYGGPISDGPSGANYTTKFFQSQVFMNVSGPAVLKAWKQFSPANPNPTLVILHDELEKPVGKVKYKKDGSAGGHNGLSSIKASLGNGKIPIHKIGIGIGRPESRDKNVVADYVLQKVPGRDKDILIRDAVPAILEIIDDIGSEPVEAD